MPEDGIGDADFNAESIAAYWDEGLLIAEKNPHCDGNEEKSPHQILDLQSRLGTVDLLYTKNQLYV